MWADRRWLFPAAIVLLFVLGWPLRHVPAARIVALREARPLLWAQSWHYQLDNIDVDLLAATSGDVLVIDYAKAQGKVPLTREDVAHIKSGPDGRERIILAYLSVGEAEEYRFYWRPEWKAVPPDWLGEENCAWPQAYRVRYWLPGWQAINFAGPDSYLKRIIGAGFDGVYLDRVDIYETFHKDRPGAREDMIAYVENLAHTAWRFKPGFYIVPQNAEALLSEARYRSSIDGLGKESLLYGLQATGTRNKPADIAWSKALLERLRAEDKPVFAVEYLLDKRTMRSAGREVRSYGFVPTFQTRALDGEDPAAPIVLTTEVGTPERTAKECPPGTSW